MAVIIQVNPIIQPHIKKLCKLPYHGHKNGCPNYNCPDVERCPSDDPNYDTPWFNEAFDMEQPIYAIINEFDYKSHIDKMTLAHPNWTQKQIKCVLYWQGTARKQLKEAIKEFKKQHPNYTVTTCPEGMGVNVTRTLKLAGYTLEWFPKTKACQVAFAGVKK